MKKNITIIILTLAIIAGVVGYLLNDRALITGNHIIVDTQVVEKMPVTVYVQDGEHATEADCGITKMESVQIPKSDNIPDASLKFLFSDELSHYGVYQSVEIASGTAKIMLASENTPVGYPISGLSSCQSQHLMSVLKDTLKQYDSITDVKLFSPTGEIVF